MPAPPVRGSAPLRSKVLDPAKIEAITQLTPDYWWRPDACTTSGGNLVALQNQGSAGTCDLVPFGTTIPEPSVSAYFNGRPTVNVVGATTGLVDGSGSTSRFAFMHNGSGHTAVVIYRPYSTNNYGRVLLSTQSTSSSSSVGRTMYATNTRLDSYVGNGSSLILSSYFTYTTAQRPTLGISSVSSTETPTGYTMTSPWSGATEAATGAFSTSSTHAAPLSIGTTTALDHADVYLADIMIFARRLSRRERMWVFNYANARYGFDTLDEPLTQSEVLLTDLKPRHWLNFDTAKTGVFNGQTRAFFADRMYGMAFAYAHANTEPPVVEEPLASGVKFFTNAAGGGHLPQSAQLLYSVDGYNKTLNFMHGPTTNMEVFANVITQSGETLPGYIFSLGPNNPAQFYMLNGTVTYKQQNSTSGYPTVFQAVTSGMATGAPATINVRYSTTANPQWSINSNNGTPTSGNVLTPDTNIASSAASIGGTALNTAQGPVRLGEIIIFDRILTTAERAVVYTHINNRYGWSF